MMHKGQIFSLDFLISVIAMVLAVGLLIQSMELQTYRMREQQNYAELRMVAETAADLLMSHPDVVCGLVDESDSPISYMNNCLTKADFALFRSPGAACEQHGRSQSIPGSCRALTAAKIILGADLGIPMQYNCRIDIENGGIAPNVDALPVYDCTDTPPLDAKNVFSVEREVVVYDSIDDSTMPKSELEDCLSGAGSCKLVEGTITLKVWKP